MSGDRHEREPGAKESRLRWLISLGLQYMRFGAVGIAATLVHVAVFSGLLEITDMMAWLANVLAFTLAIIASFLGHFHWTFRQVPDATSDSATRQRRAFPRFVLTAVLGLGLNTLAAYLIVDVKGYPYLWAVLVMLLIVPPAIFLVAKLWAFKVR